MGRPLSRRAFVLGAVPSALLASTSSAVEISAPSTDREDPLLALGRQLKTISRRCARLQRDYLRLEANSDAGSDATWRAWSKEIDRGLDLAVRIRKTSATSISGMTAKIDAAIFELCEATGDSDPGEPLRRRLMCLRRELFSLVARG